MQRRIAMTLLLALALTVTGAPGSVGPHIPGAYALAEQGLDTQTEVGFMRNGRNIPEELARIPEGYRQPAPHPGTLERLTYETWDSLTYAEHSRRLTKEAWVYLPYGYTAEQRYNIFYISHGGWSDETSTLGTAERPKYLKHAIDHAIEEGRMAPMIIVCPTYNNLSPSDSGDYGLALELTDNFHNELLNDLIPAVEERYHTWADFDASPAGQRASRDHRGFGGFSMGSVNTWHTFQYCLDSFRYFMPMSGSMGDGGWARDVVLASGWTDRDFFLWTATGTADFAGAAFAAQIDSMTARYGDVFHLADNEEGNISSRIRKGGAHDEQANFDYTFNALCWFWNAEARE